MPRLTLAPAFTRWLDPASPAATVGGSADEVVLAVRGGTVREVLEAGFALHPRLRSYVLDERGALRHHVVLFVDGTALVDKANQAQPVEPHAQLYLMQALSGG